MKKIEGTKKERREAEGEHGEKRSKFKTVESIERAGVFFHCKKMHQPLFGRKEGDRKMRKV